MKDDYVVQRTVKAPSKGETVAADKVAAATGYVTDIGRRKRYRLLTLVGLSIKESLASLDVPKK